MARAWRSRQIWRGLARVACSLGEGAGELQHASCFLPRAPSQALSHSALPTTPQPAASTTAALLRPQHTCPAAQPGISFASRQLLTQAQHAQQQQQQQRSICSTAGAAAAAGGGSSGTGAEQCPLHACLLRYGITDLAAYSKPRHLAVSQEAVDAGVEPKLAALRAEGLSPAQLLKLMPAKGDTILPCSYQDTFAPNLELLRSIAALRKPGRRRKGQQQLTAAGQVLSGNAGAVAQYLSRSPEAVQRLLNWLKRRLGIGLAELAGCSGLLNALTLSEEACQKVALLLLGKGVPVARVAKAFLALPSIFRQDPMLVEAKLGFLASTLQVDAATALDLVLKEPRLLAVNLEGRLPQLLAYLDGYMGEKGAGRRLVLQALTLATKTVAIVQRGVSNLDALGYSQQQIQVCINQCPSLLWCDLTSPDQQQKIEWIETMSPWTLHDFLLVHPQYFFASTRRLASRLAWMRAAGLELPRSPGTLAMMSDATFVARMSRRLQKGMGSTAGSSEWAAVKGVADWKLWEEEWLQTEEGQRWGFLPEK